MAEITAKLISDLRAKTSAGMMDCKQALIETNGDFEQAEEWLRKKGLLKAGKKATRIASAGLVGIKVQGNKGVIVEVNCETDFVASNVDFQNLVRESLDAGIVVEGDIEKLKEIRESDVVNATATIGEKIEVRRSAFVSAPVIASYIHTTVVENMGKIGVLVGLQGEESKALEVGKKVAMHIAASKPDFLNISDVSVVVIEKEKAFQREQALNSGKPADIVEKMLAGRISKFYEEIVLLEQPFVMDPSKKVKDILEGCTVVDYKMLILGDGIQKKEENYADEVASMLK